jgi:hypothetical protein
MATIERFQSEPTCHTVRPHLDQQIHKMDLRFWLAEDGYAILQGQARQHLRILELVSTSGNEIGMIRAILDWNFGQDARWALSRWDRERLGRLMAFASYWSGGNSDMYRINDLPVLLSSADDHLNDRAAAVQDFALAVGMKERDRTTVTTIRVQDGKVAIEPGNHTEDYIELTAVEAARLFLGGPPIAREDEVPQELLALLPVPVYVLPLDHV